MDPAQELWKSIRPLGARGWGWGQVLQVERDSEARALPPALPQHK